jgi:hypothetical protein
MFETKEGHCFIDLDINADNTLTPERLAELHRMFSSEAMWQREICRNAHALSGQKVYPEFDTAVHVVPDENVPRKLVRYMAIDPHPRTPHAFLWIGVDELRDVWAYRELWPSKAYGENRSLRDTDEDNFFTVREYCDVVAQCERNKIDWRKAETSEEYGVYIRSSSGENIVTRYMDQAGKGFKDTESDKPSESLSVTYARYGIGCADPYKSHAAGEDAIRDLLQMRNHSVYGKWPRLHIAASLKELIWELRTHRYRTTRTPTDERELKQQTAEARCHLIDLLRYLATSGATYIPNLVS